MHAISGGWGGVSHGYGINQFHGNFNNFGNRYGFAHNGGEWWNRGENWGHFGRYGFWPYSWFPWYGLGYGGYYPYYAYGYGYPGDYGDFVAGYNTYPYTAAYAAPVTESPSLPRPRKMGRSPRKAQPARLASSILPTPARPSAKPITATRCGWRAMPPWRRRGTPRCTIC